MRVNPHSPDAGWIPILKVVFGFAILIVLAVLAAIIALGKVQEASSYGLNIILGGLLTLAGGYASWAFRDERTEENKRDEIQSEETHH